MTGFEATESRQVYDQEFIRRSVTAQAMLNVSHQCHFCQVASSAFDLACSRCHVSVCSDCLCARLVNNPRCPRCGDTEVFNEHSIRILAGAAQVGKTATQLFGGLWELGNQLFDGSPSQGSSQPVPPFMAKPPSPLGRHSSDPGALPSLVSPSYMSSQSQSSQFDVVRRKHGSDPGRGPFSSNKSNGADPGLGPFASINFNNMHGFQVNGDREVASPSRNFFPNNHVSDAGHFVEL